MRALLRVMPSFVAPDGDSARSREKNKEVGGYKMAQHRRQSYELETARAVSRAQSKKGTEKSVTKWLDVITLSKAHMKAP